MTIYRCSVLNCGNGKCVHELIDELCPYCGCKMVRVTAKDFMFCSNTTVCDYEKETEGDTLKTEC